MKPRLLDLFCGAGGAGMGYARAGFDVTGVDIKPMPRYPFAFIQGDALEYLTAHGHEYEAIHASPPCQRYTALQVVRGREHPDLVAPTRKALEATGKPWVIENVVGAPMNTTIVLCGAMFGLKVYRHRLFESNQMLFQPHHELHRDSTPRAGRGISPKGFISVAGNTGNADYARLAMGIDWMNRDQLSQAIPPAYTEYIGKQLMAALGQERAA
jgi:DNA (cytosine-5)-methyltransferase 1